MNDDTKKTTMADSDTQEEPNMSETGGDVRALDPSKELGQKGGETIQQKQEEQSYQEFGEKGGKSKSEASEDQPTDDDLWGED